MIERKENDFLKIAPKSDAMWGKPLEKFEDLLKLKNFEIKEYHLIMGEEIHIQYVARWMEPLKKWAAVVFSCSVGFKEIVENESNRVYFIYERKYNG
jgi:hypothetical protein